MSCKRCVLLFVVLAPGCSLPHERAALEELMQHRTRVDHFMATEGGPLTEAQRGVFKGLAYFNADFDLVFEAPLEVDTAPDTVKFVNSHNSIETYLHVGTFHFHYQGRQALEVFRPAAGGDLFLPFADATNGNETYGGGRYVNLEELPDGRMRLDFNRAYNPYCAYNDRWICPLPPPENRLDFAVRAGERKFPYGDKSG